MRSADKNCHLPSRVQFLENRIKELEKCIGEQVSPTTRFEDVTPSDDMRKQSAQATHVSNPVSGLLLSGPSGTRYINSAHWQTIMNAVSIIPPHYLLSSLLSDYCHSLNRLEHLKKAALIQTAEPVLTSLHECLVDLFY